VNGALALTLSARAVGAARALLAAALVAQVLAMLA
jgi:hypothetical protein